MTMTSSFKDSNPTKVSRATRCSISSAHTHICFDSFQRPSRCRCRLPMPWSSLGAALLARQDALQPRRASQLGLGGVHVMPVVRASALVLVALPRRLATRLAMLRLKPKHGPRCWLRCLPASEPAVPELLAQRCMSVSANKIRRARVVSLGSCVWFPSLSIIIDCVI
jgi:hypothetical protein